MPDIKQVQCLPFIVILIYILLIIFACGCQRLARRVDAKVILMGFASAHFWATFHSNFYANHCNHSQDRGLHGAAKWLKLNKNTKMSPEHLQPVLGFSEKKGCIFNLNIWTKAAD